MYEKVKTRRQQRKFEKTWEYFCKKYNWYNDPYAKDGDRYNLLLHKRPSYKPKKVIGTVEFIPYDPNNPNSTVEGINRFEFSKLSDVRLYQNRTWEVDKLCIHEDYQRKGYFLLFLHIIMEHANKHNTKYYLALIEKRLYQMLKVSFGSNVEQQGSPLVGPGDSSLIPTTIHIEKLLMDEKGGKYRRLYNKTSVL